MSPVRGFGLSGGHVVQPCVTPPAPSCKPVTNPHVFAFILPYVPPLYNHHAINIMMLIRQSQGDYNIIDNVIYYIIVPLAEPRQRRLLARFAGQENGPRRTSADTVGQSCCSLLRCLVSCFFDYLKPALEFQHSRRSRSVILLCDC